MKSSFKKLLKGPAMSQRLILEPKTKSDVPIKGIVFDLDGTLCLPQTWMFAAMRDSIGLIDRTVDILVYIDAMKEEDQVSAKQKIAAVEEKAMRQMEPQPGLVELMTFLSKENLPKAICTRNLITPVNHLVNSFLPDQKFDPIITRDFLPPKPHPAPILHIAETWDLDPKHLIMVGDSIDDMKSGKKAGATTVLITSHANASIKNVEYTDYVIDRLDHLIQLIQEGLIIKP